MFLPAGDIVYYSTIHRPFGAPTFGRKAESSYRPGEVGEDDMAKRTGLPEQATQKEGSPRRRFMTGEQVAAIVALIRDWPALPMTWDAIRGAIERGLPKAGRRLRTEKAWSRQALSVNAAIKMAYDDRRAQLLDEAKRGVKRRQRSREPAVLVLERQVDRLKAENDALRGQLATYEAKFRRMVMNLHRGETTEEGLDNPLPERVDRRPRDD